MECKEFAKTLFGSPVQMLPHGTDAQACLNILADHFLGRENTIIQGCPASVSQWNSEVTHEILKKYPSGKIRRIYERDISQKGERCKAMGLSWMELIKDWWVLLWFLSGTTFFVLGTISAFNNENEKALGCLGIALACHARCEVKILQRKMENNNGNN